MVLLDVKNINVFYGHIHALKNLSLHVDKGNIVTLIGANGAGKTTLLTTISGINRPTTGTIEYHYNDVTYNLEKIKPHKIVALKLTQVP